MHLGIRDSDNIDKGNEGRGRRAPQAYGSEGANPRAPANDGVDYNKGQG